MFTVITEVPEPESGGNMAAVVGLYEVAPESEDNPYGLKVRQIDGPRGLDVLLRMRHEVFVLGEILILDEYGREYAGHGRKPDKWSVQTETFDSIDDAIAKAKEVSGW